MTDREIGALSDVELNARIAEGAGWKWFGRSDEHESDCWLLRPDWLERPGRIPVGLDIERKRPAFETDKQWAFAARDVPRYSESLDLCRPAEIRLADLGLKTEYVEELMRMVPFPVLDFADVDSAMRCQYKRSGTAAATTSLVRASCCAPSSKSR